MTEYILYGVVIYFAVISIIAFAVTIYDKHAAKIAGKRRIPEKNLMLISALGGSVAMLLTMLTIRHKTRHIKFMAGIPIILFFQIIVVLYVLKEYVFI